MVRSYEQGGACAISVLTDETYFGGSIKDLCIARSSTRLPLLRKDFIIDPIQIFEAAIAGADAVLLIATVLDDSSLQELRVVAEGELNLDAVVEVHSSEELNRALSAGAKIIGVNNRDLKTFRVSLNTSERLIAEAPRDRIMVSESGLQEGRSLRHLRTLGFHGFLIGEALMRAPDPETALRDLVASAEDRQTVNDEIVGRLCQTPRRFTETPYKHRSVQIKICGVTNLKDAMACAELGAHMIGFNFYPQSPRYVEPIIVGRIIEAISPGVCAVGVFVDASTEEIRNIAHTAGLRCVQLHGPVSRETCSELAREFRVVRAFSTDPRFRPEEISRFGDCDVLIDAYHPDLRGGTGLRCDWLAARTTCSFARFLILSGGLTEQNVGRAIATVAPHCVDVCSGVESAPGLKDHKALANFVTAVQNANFLMTASPG
jgi:indole-3-glycerol phosphate synthase/phosphoribosylanthranilate isomerase